MQFSGFSTKLRRYQSERLRISLVEGDRDPGARHQYPGDPATQTGGPDGTTTVTFSKAEPWCQYDNAFRGVLDAAVIRGSILRINS